VEIKWLRTFVVAAHYENFRQASEVLYISQPTITVHMKHLEEDIGLPLFERSGRNVILTSAGYRFLPHAKRILESYDSGIHDLTGWRQGYHRKLTLSVSPLIAMSILPPIINRFMKQYPDIEVMVKVTESIQIGEAVSGGVADYGLSRMEPIQKDLFHYKLYDDPVILVASEVEGNNADGSETRIGKLITEKVILTHNHPVYWDDLLAEIRRQFQHVRTMVVSQVHITKRFIEEGLGISFLPRSTVEQELKEGRMIEVNPGGIRLPSAATYVVYKRESPEVKAFERFIREYYV
jgi:LysR family transcriptional repressor of citA